MAANLKSETNLEWNIAIRKISVNSKGENQNIILADNEENEPLSSAPL